MGSTGDKISGKINEMAGKAKKAAGKTAGEREMQATGGMREAKGKDQVATGNAKDRLKGAVDRL